MKKNKIPTITITYTALMCAMVAVTTMTLSIRTGVSNTNLGDTMIFLTAVLFGPIPAMIAGGLGSFIADLLTYPTTMFFTLIIKGTEGLVAGLIVRKAKSISKDKQFYKYSLYALGMTIGAICMVTGYFFAKYLFYGTFESAMISLPKNIVQGSLSIIIALPLSILLEKRIGHMLKNYKKRCLEDKTD